MANLDQASETSILKSRKPVFENKVFCRYCNEITMEKRDIKPTPYLLILPIVLYCFFGYWCFLGLILFGQSTLWYRFRCFKCKEVLSQGNYFSVAWNRGFFDPPELVVSPVGFIEFLIAVAVFTDSALPDTWLTYQSKCGKEAISRDPAQAIFEFNQRYRGATVDWEGNLHTGWYLDYQETGLPEAYGGCFQIMMNQTTPPQSDLYLCSPVDKETVISAAKNWTYGGKVSFSAVFHSMGTVTTNPYLRALKVKSKVLFDQQLEDSGQDSPGKFLQDENSTIP